MLSNIHGYIVMIQNCYLYINKSVLNHQQREYNKNCNNNKNNINNNINRSGVLYQRLVDECYIKFDTDMINVFVIFSYNVSSVSTFSSSVIDE